MYNENDIINKLRELLERQPAAFQKGRALNGGVGKQITVNINGKKIKALSYNVISPNEVTVFYDSTHDRYIAWQQPNRVLRSDKLIYRRTKPTPIKRTFGKYLFKVFTRVVNSLLKVQGFGSDVEIENSDGYELVGLTNTGDGYVAIAKSGDTYLFDVDGEQVTRTLTPADFGLTYVPSLYWYGGDIIYGFNQDFGEINNQSYTFTNSGCITSVSQFGTLTWSEFISLNPNEITIPYSISQVNHSGGEGGEGNIGQLVRKYDWQLGLLDETFNNYSYLTYDVDKSGIVYFLGFKPSSFYMTKVIDSQRSNNHIKQFIVLDEDTLSVLNKLVTGSISANITRERDKVPRSPIWTEEYQTWSNYDMDKFVGVVTEVQTLTSFSLDYCSPSHLIQVSFNYEWNREFEFRGINHFDYSEEEGFHWISTLGLPDYSYTNDLTNNTSSLESNCEPILISRNQQFTIYWFWKIHYLSVVTEFQESIVGRIAVPPEIGSGVMQQVTVIRPPTKINDSIYYNPTTYLLGIKQDTNFYEVKDFGESSGFDFSNRFYAYKTTSVTEPTIGSNVITCSISIGLHPNNKGNYQTVIKQNTSTQINNGTPSYDRVYHPITVFEPVGLDIDLYWVSSNRTVKYVGTITDVDYTTSTNSTTGEVTRNYTGLTVNLTSQEEIDFICYDNSYSEGIFISASGDYTRFLLDYIQSDIRKVNCYEQDDKMRIAISKIPQQTDTTAYADIYEFDTVNKKFIRIGNDSSDLSTIDDTSNYISYHP